MSDLISRQAAIDAMCKLMYHWFGGDSKDEVREINQELGKLPSPQPETEWNNHTVACLLAGIILGGYLHDRL